MNKILSILITLTLLTGCTQFSILGSTTGVVVANSVPAKLWSTVDLGTSLITKKDIKTHVYTRILILKKEE
jgi:hypothetical protein